MESENVKTQLEKKDGVIHKKDDMEVMAHTESKQKRLANTGGWQDLPNFNRKQIEGTLSSSSEPISEPVRKTRSMGVPPYMDGETLSEAISAFPFVPELRVVLLGRQEAKQAVAEALLGREIVVPQTQWSESRQAKVAERKVTVVHTPDWFSPGFSHSLRRDVRRCMELSSPGPNIFLLIILVDALEGEEGNILDKMEEIFGETCWEYTIILFTSTESMVQLKIEEIIDENQELKQLVGNAKHYEFFYLSASEANISLMRTVEKVIDGNNYGFFNSQMYLEAETWFREMNNKMQQEKEQRKEKRKRTEKEMEQRLEKTLQESLIKLNDQIREHEDEFMSLHERISTLERERKDEKNEGRVREVEKELYRETAKREEVEKKMSALKEKNEKERKEKEAKHKAEIEELKKRYKREARAHKERNLMKLLLSDYHERINLTKPLVENHLVPLLGGHHGQLRSLMQIKKDNNEGQKERQRQDNQRQIEEMCVEMASLSQALLERVRSSAEKPVYKTPEE